MTVRKSDSDVQRLTSKYMDKSDTGAAELDKEESRLDQLIETTIKEQQQKLGKNYYQQGKIKELRLKHEEAYKALTQAVNCDPDNIEYLNAAGLSGNEIAAYELAQQFLDKSLKLTISEYGENHPNTATSYNNLASNLEAQGKHDKAELLYRKSDDIHQHASGEEYGNES